MGSKIKVEINPGDLDKLSKEISENIKNNGFDFTCPQCGEHSLIHSSEFLCPHCGHQVRVEFQL